MLDREPNRQEAVGDRIVTSRNGAGVEYERGMGKPAKTTVESLIDRRGSYHRALMARCSAARLTAR